MRNTDKIAQLAQDFLSKVAEFDYDKRPVEELAKYPDATLKQWMQIEQLSLPKYNEVSEFRKAHPNLPANPIPDEAPEAPGRRMQESK